MRKSVLLPLIAFSAAFFSGNIRASSLPELAEKLVASSPSIGSKAKVKHDGFIEYAFSPDKGAENLVLNVIGSAKYEIRVMAYAFTSSRITAALIAAKKRGADVALIVDRKHNAELDASGKARAALSALVNAGCRVRTTDAFAIHHDKAIIVDRETVQTGSFNYSASAARRNSENVLVVWKNPELARAYLEHWANRYNGGSDFATRY